MLIAIIICAALGTGAIISLGRVNGHEPIVPSHKPATEVPHSIAVTYEELYLQMQADIIERIPE